MTTDVIAALEAGGQESFEHLQGSLLAAQGHFNRKDMAKLNTVIAQMEFELRIIKIIAADILTEGVLGQRLLAKAGSMSE